MIKKRLRRVLLIEPHAEGHHAVYLAWMVEALLEAGYEITVQTTSKAAKHPGFDAVSKMPAQILPMAEQRSIPGLTVEKGLMPLIKREFGYWRLFHSWYKEFEASSGVPDIVFLPYLDYCLYAIGIFGSPFDQTQWGGVAMRPSFHYATMGVVTPKPALSSVKHTLFARALRCKNLRLLFTVDEPLLEYSRKRRLGIKKIEFLPEPADFVSFPTRESAREHLGLPSEKLSILVYGAVTMRKGIDRLLDAALDPEFPKRVTVIVAGRPDEEVRRYLQRTEIQALARASRLILIDRFIAPEEEGVLFSAADAVWLGYVNHYNASGVLVQAARAGRPVIACRDGVLGWQANRHKMGWIIDVARKNDILRAVHSLVTAPKKAARLGRNGQLSYAGHSLVNSMKVMNNGFKTKFDLDPDLRDDFKGCEANRK